MCVILCMSAFSRSTIRVSAWFISSKYSPWDLHWVKISKTRLPKAVTHTRAVAHRHGTTHVLQCHVGSRSRAPRARGVQRLVGVWQWAQCRDVGLPGMHRSDPAVGVKQHLWHVLAKGVDPEVSLSTRNFVFCNFVCCILRWQCVCLQPIPKDSVFFHASDSSMIWVMGHVQRDMWQWDSTAANLFQQTSSFIFSVTLQSRVVAFRWQTAHCEERFNARPLREGTWLAHTMGLYELKAGFPGGYSRVIFSNGLQDPWSAGEFALLVCTTLCRHQRCDVIRFVLAYV